MAVRAKRAHRKNLLRLRLLKHRHLTAPDTQHLCVEAHPRHSTSPASLPPQKVVPRFNSALTPIAEPARQPAALKKVHDELAAS